MTLAELALLGTAFGAGTILKGLLDRILDRRKGRLTAEQNAWEQRDSWARYARRLEEAAHETRTAWHRETGKPYAEMPEWPSRTK